MHRYEPSGALHGLMRVRAVHPGRRAHLHAPRTRSPRNRVQLDRAAAVDLSRLRLRRRARQVRRPARQARRLGRGLGPGRGRAEARPSRRPGIDYELNPGEGAFYGPSSNSCCATPSAATGSAAPCRSTSTCRRGSAPIYIDETARSSTPVMLHRAIFGSLERFIGILIEHHAGRLPLWLAPVQAWSRRSSPTPTPMPARCLRR